MAIRKPTAPADKSAAMAEILATAGQESKFKNGAIVEGTISAIKGEDVFVDIGYKSVGAIGLDEFGEGADVKIGDKVSVLIVKIEDDKTGMVELSKRLRYALRLLSSSPDQTKKEALLGNPSAVAFSELKVPFVDVPDDTLSGTVTPYTSLAICASSAWVNILLVPPHSATAAPQ